MSTLEERRAARRRKREMEDSGGGATETPAEDTSSRRRRNRGGDDDTDTAAVEEEVPKTVEENHTEDTPASAQDSEADAEELKRQQEEKRQREKEEADLARQREEEDEERERQEEERRHKEERARQKQEAEEKRRKEQEEKERLEREEQERLEAERMEQERLEEEEQAKHPAKKKKKGKRKGLGGLSPEKKKMLKKLIMQKAAEDLKNEALEKAHEREKIINERVAPLKTDGLGEAELQKLCKDLQAKVAMLQEDVYDWEVKIRKQDYEINELTIKINDAPGKFIKPVLRKVNKTESKLEKLQRKAADKHGDFRSNLKSTGQSKFALDDVEHHENEKE